MREVSVQVLVDERAKARTKPLLAVLAVKLSVATSRTDAMRSFDVAGLRAIVDHKIAMIVGGEPVLVMEPDGSVWMATANPQPRDPHWEARVRRAVDRECDGAD